MVLECSRFRSGTGRCCNALGRVAAAGWFGRGGRSPEAASSSRAEAAARVTSTSSGQAPAWGGRTVGVAGAVGDSVDVADAAEIIGWIVEKNNTKC